MIEITLSQYNLFHAGLIGVSRHIKGAHKKGTYGVDNSKVGWQINCDGACGEAVLAKWLDKWYDGCIGDFQAADVGYYQVRTNPNHWGDLILHEKDKDEDVYVLILSHKSPTFFLAGWLRGRDGKLEKYWRDGAKDRPAFFVPQKALNSMGCFPGKP